MQAERRISPPAWSQHHNRANLAGPDRTFGELRRCLGAGLVVFAVARPVSGVLHAASSRYGDPSTKVQPPGSCREQEEVKRHLKDSGQSWTQPELSWKQ